MGESGLSQPNEAEDSFDAEVSDLRDVSRQRARHVAVWSALPLPDSRLSPRQRLTRGMTSTATILFALLALIIGMRGLPNLHLFERQPQPPLTLRTDPGAISFLLDMAWSPDSKRVALLGCQSARLGPCDAMQHYAPNTVLIYAAATGKLVTRIAPDPPVLQELHVLDPTDVPAPPANGLVPVLEGVQLLYSAVLWSPDGRRLALPFFASVLPRAGLGLIWGGIVLVDSDGTHPRALFAPNLANASPLWDMVAGSPLPLADASASVTPLEIPPALTYGWDSHDTLVAQLPLMPGALAPRLPLTSIGNPDGGQSFTIWQPGQILPVSGPGTAGGGSALFGYVYNTTFVPWSPDGSRLAERSGRHPAAPLDVSAVLVPLGRAPPQPASSTRSGQLAQFDYLPVRDPALQELLTLGSSASRFGASGWIVAWRPDGRALAAYGIANAGDVAKVVTLYDCVTGRILATLPPAPGGSAPLDGYNGGMLRWSPDGTRLLAYVQGSDVLSIWDITQLG